MSKSWSQSKEIRSNYDGKHGEVWIARQSRHANAYLARWTRWNEWTRWNSCTDFDILKFMHWPLIVRTIFRCCCCCSLCYHLIFIVIIVIIQTFRFVLVVLAAAIIHWHSNLYLMRMLLSSQEHELFNFYSNFMEFPISSSSSSSPFLVLLHSISISSRLSVIKYMHAFV